MLTHFVEIAVRVIQDGCLAIIAWIIWMGKKEFFTAIRSHAMAAANEETRKTIAPIVSSIKDLEKWDQEHEKLDDRRHDEIMREIRRRPSRGFTD